MRELVIHNLTLVVDARLTDAVAEAHRVVQWVNEALDKNDGGPTLIFSSVSVKAEYRENGESDE